MLNCKLLFLFVAIIAFSNFGCIDRGSRQYKEISSQADKESTKKTDKAISESFALQNLQKICRNLPLFSQIEPNSKSVSRRSTFLTFSYQLKKDFDDLKELYKKQLPQDGWILKKEEEGLWEDQIEFEKENILIHIASGQFGDENYAVSCEDTSINP